MSVYPVPIIPIRLREAETTFKQLQRKEEPLRQIPVIMVLCCATKKDGSRGVLRISSRGNPILSIQRNGKEVAQAMVCKTTLRTLVDKGLVSHPTCKYVAGMSTVDGSTLALTTEGLQYGLNCYIEARPDDFMKHDIEAPARFRAV